MIIFSGQISITGFNVFPVALPSLKDRKEDIPQLVEVFLRRLNTFHSKPVSDIHPRVLEAFLAYSWPGNIRELENVLERAYILEKIQRPAPGKFSCRTVCLSGESPAWHH